MVDSFKFLPRLIATFYQMTEREPALPIPWTAVSKPVNACKFGLLTSAGLYHKGEERPFDTHREKTEPEWGDPTYRVIPQASHRNDIGISHLHLNTADLAQDVNIQLPLDRFQELADKGDIGGIATNHISVMGYQGFPPDATVWTTTYGPEIAMRFKAEGVDCVLLTTA